VRVTTFENKESSSNFVQDVNNFGFDSDDALGRKRTIDFQILFPMENASKVNLQLRDSKDLIHHFHSHQDRKCREDLKVMRILVQVIETPWITRTHPNWRKKKALKYRIGSWTLENWKLLASTHLLGRRA